MTDDEMAKAKAEFDAAKDLIANLPFPLQCFAGLAASLVFSTGEELARAEAENARLRGALTKIKNWELPPSGQVYPNADGTDSTRPAPYDSAFAYGAQGGKQAVIEIARAALEGRE